MNFPDIFQLEIFHMRLVTLLTIVLHINKTVFLTKKFFTLYNIKNIINVIVIEYSKKVPDICSLSHFAAGRK